MGNRIMMSYDFIGPHFVLDMLNELPTHCHLLLLQNAALQERVMQISKADSSGLHQRVLEELPVLFVVR